MPHSQTPPETDWGGIELPRLRMSREIPLWGLICLMGALGAQAIALYYALQRQAEELARQGVRQAEISQDIKAVATEMQKSTRESLETNFKLQSLEQRVRILETQPPGRRP